MAADHRPTRAPQIQQRPQRDHLARGVPDLKLPDVPVLIAEPLIRHDVDLPGTAELIKIIHIIRSKVDLECVEDVAERDPERHALGPVDIQVQPWGIGARAVEQVLESWCPPSLIDDPVAHPLEFVQAQVAAILDHHLEAARRAQAVDGWGAEGRHRGPRDLAPASVPHAGRDRVGR
jgi:hypothetical protein